MNKKMLRTSLSKLNQIVKTKLNLNLNTARVINTSRVGLYQKKSGVFEEQSNIQNVKTKVKLYPGYQESYEEKIIKKSEETYGN